MTADEPMSTPDSGGLREAACEVMHDAYEAAAITEGWETQERSRKPWADVPEANKATMRAAVSALLDWLGDSSLRSLVLARHTPDGDGTCGWCPDRVRWPCDHRRAALLAAHPEPVSTSNSGGLKAEAWRAAEVYDDLLTQVQEAPVGAVERRLHRVLGDLVHVVLAPDSADDVTVGERESVTTLLHSFNRWTGMCGCGEGPLITAEWVTHYKAQDEPVRIARPATPPADDANRAPVSGGLDEGEREALAFAVCPDLTHTIHEGHDLCDAMTDRISDWLAARDAAWVERMAVVKGERDEARAEVAEVRYELGDALTTLEASLMGTPSSGCAWGPVGAPACGSGTRTLTYWCRHCLMRGAEAAEAERDTARRERADAWDEGKAAGLREGKVVTPFHDRFRSANPYRADALTSDDGSGA